MMTKRALLLNGIWGSPIHGGIPGATREIIRLLKQQDFEVHCMLLHDEDMTDEEAHTLGVHKVIPKPNDEYYGTEPNWHWLYINEHCYPHLKELKDVSIIIGFDLLSSMAANRVHEELFKNASVFLMNTRKHDVEYYSEIIPCSKSACERKIVSHIQKQSKEADCVFSLWKRTFDIFKERYANLNVAHQTLFLTPETKYFDQRAAGKPTDVQPIIISAMESDCAKNENNVFEGFEILAAYVNRVCDRRSEKGSDCPEWKIFGVPSNEKRERKIESLVKSGYLTISPIDCKSTEMIDMELYSSHLALMPPGTVSSLKFALVNMAIGIPIFMPTNSECSAFIKHYLPYWENDVVVNMMEDSPGEITRKIIKVFRQDDGSIQNVSQQRAQHIKAKLKEVTETINHEFLATVSSALKKEMPQNGTTTMQECNTVTPDMTHGVK